ncbi:hypothetical protein [Raoultibacter phocaeensis]|nr:hypothetical protein [Raoultibacter phocaeensis]
MSRSVEGAKKAAAAVVGLGCAPGYPAEPDLPKPEYSVCIPVSEAHQC